MKRHWKSFLGSLGLLLLMGLGMAWAELSYKDFILYGDVELGGLFLADDLPDKKKGKLEEYRDLGTGVTEDMFLYILSKDLLDLYEIRAWHAGWDDQSYSIRANRTGLYDAEFIWDEIPHVLSTTSPLSERIDTQRNKAQFNFSFTPTPEWDIWTEYIFTDRDGKVPRGTATDPRHAPWYAYYFNQLLQPTRFSDNDMTFSAALNKIDYQFQLSYSLSLFQNDLSSVPADPDVASGKNRLSLPPDNLAHTITASGGVNLPWKTRINSSASYSLRLQDDDLLPPLGNPSQNPGSFDGQVNTLLYYLSAVSRPLDPLTLRAIYRMYHYDDDSTERTFPFHDDLNGETYTVFARRYPFDRHTATLDAAWKLSEPLTLDLGYTWERWERDPDVMGVGQTDDQTPKVALNYAPLEWLSMELSYSASFRTTSDNELAKKIINSPRNPPPPGHPQRTDCGSCHGFGGPGNPMLTRFDLAERDRNEVELLAEITPVSNVTISPTFTIANDEYGDSVFGLLEDQNWSAGVSISWRPVNRVALYMTYLHEEYLARQRVDQRIDIDPTFVLNTDDRVDTFGLALNVGLMPQKLDLDLQWNLSLGLSDLNDRRLPDLEDNFNQYSATLRYQVNKNWRVRLGYVLEVFDIGDAYAHNVSVFGQSISAEEYYRDYTAHMVALNLGYQF